MWADLFKIKVAAIITKGKIAATITLTVIKFIFLGVTPINEVKIHCCCKLLRKVLEGALMFNDIKVVRSSGVTPVS